MKPTIIIAEAGVNHNGSIELAKRLVDVAAESGCDYIKFQTFKTELIISENARKADYQLKNAEDKSESQFEMAKKLELTFDDFKDLKKYCLKKKIGFLSTGFDPLSLDFLLELGQDFFKIPSGEITNKPFLKQIAQFGKPILLSTGMANLLEIEDALKILTSEGLSKKDIIILHCNTEYPTPMVDVNLLAMKSIESYFGVSVGYSDHTLGIEVPIAAVSLGADVIEKHFTLDRSMSGPDHKASLEPDELKSMVQAIRNVELAISGSGDKVASSSEISNIPIARRSIHLSTDLLKGATLKVENLIMKRPGTGISPMEIDSVIGKRLNQSISAGTMLSWNHLN